MSLRKLAIAATTITLAACNSNQAQDSTEISISDAAVIQNYIQIAQANYGDSLASAETLQKQVNEFLANPTEENLATAKEAWIAARAPYQQTEVYRFGNAVIDDWEGKVNAWPLDEGLIDYVDSSYGTESDENGLYTANIIANKTFTVGGQTIDASAITPTLISEQLHEIDEVEANVASGYHAIEFLLWGQDLNGTKPGAGTRPATDFSIENCTNGNCDRRRDYLVAATELLISDLKDIVAAWEKDGVATKDLEAKGDKGGLVTILTGMGSLSYGELAGERIKLGLMLHDPEEEHDCFSDNTHWSHYYDALGIKNAYLGEYTDIQGNKVNGASLSQLVAATDPALDQEMKAKLEATEAAMQAMVNAADKGNTFDVLIGEGNTEGNQIIQNVVDALVSQTNSIEKVIVALKLDKPELEGSDSLDNPDAVGA